MENRDDKKRRRTPTSIDSLSDDDLITILVKLSAQDIHDAGRLVCRRWYRLIRSPEFIHTHLQSSPAGIIIQCHINDELRSAFVGMSQGRIETYKLRYNFTDTVLSSCNGLVLLRDHDRNRLFVANLATKQHFSIPLFGERILHNCFMCLGYIAASMEYKVVHVNHLNECAILTVGVDDSWRHLPTSHLPTNHLSNNILYTLFVTEGFVHWVNYSTDILMTLNLETETISDIPLPEGLGWSHCFSAGKCLSFISFSHTGLCWEVWEMRPGTVVEWDRLADIDLADKVRTDEKFSSTESCLLEPVGWIKYKEVLLFVCDELCTFVAYNVCTGEFESFELDFPRSSSSYHYVDHTNSLVWLDGSYV